MGVVFEFVGFAFASIGLLIEAVGMAAMGYYPLRRRLPISPLSLAGIGDHHFV
jgi:hypothetical protein